jgi:hypothetical protein
MQFDPTVYGGEVAAILALDGNGERLMPLAEGHCSSREAHSRLSAASAAKLFARSRAPEAALSGLWLYFSCLDESHSLSQEIHTVDGSFWHGILHRQEPDAGNAAYWFRKVGKHAVFPALAAAARGFGYAAGGQWDALGFIEYCEEARQRPGSAEEKLALAVQRAEWQFLFHYCAEPAR